MVTKVVLRLIKVKTIISLIQDETSTCGITVVIME